MLNLSRAQTSSCWSGVVVKRGQLKYRPRQPLFKITRSVSKTPRVAEQCDVIIHSLDHESSLKLQLLEQNLTALPANNIFVMLVKSVSDLRPLLSFVKAEMKKKVTYKPSVQFRTSCQVFPKDLGFDTTFKEMFCDARELADKIDIPANLELTQPHHTVRRRNVNFDYEARVDPTEDPTFKYKAGEVETGEAIEELAETMHINQDSENDFMRGRIIGKIEEGRKITDVAREFDIAHSVVSRLWKSFKTTGMCSIRDGGGRVRSKTPSEDRYIVLSAKRNRRTTA
ncbi:uncharacterized protein TNCV_2241381 [Trichonephila clavipes]|nr:uncharacterized protein TNCV_2241381 [Trichonephila clavipes]